ncbi:alpha/beta hydrolase family protein [Nocardia cyriacigeorgica]|uniref:alpha/beta hydrolase family protein n=1 Tax=Nocardia cyriacigeorgica TaxID=135487 RepID=UPI002458955C|nr:hypothetical protein [Nocardia cyriacigeorgica]
MDASRPDPFSGAANRQISVTAWYPTTDTGPVARYLSSNDGFDATMALDLTNGLEGRSCFSWFGGAPSCFGVSLADTMHPRIRARETRAVLNAVPHPGIGALPVAIVSPGFGVPGNHLSILAQDLASHGYLVLTLSHTWESIVTELATSVAKQNGGAVSNAWAKVLAARVGDARFVLDQLAVLPHGVGAVANLDRVAVVGHSFGGPTGLELAYADSRVKAVAVLDGTAGYTGCPNLAQDNGIAQPVMLLSGPINLDDNYLTGAEHTSWASYAATNHGPLHMLEVAGARHYAFTDVGLLSTKTAELCGTISPARAMALHTLFVRAFLDRYLSGVSTALLDGAHPDWPEVTAV